MIKQLIKIGRRFNWSRSLNEKPNETAVTIIVHMGNREYHMVSSPQKVNVLQAMRNTLEAIMDAEFEVKGDIFEVWEKRQVPNPAYDREECARIR
jgi:hypothetical protein